VESGTDRGFLRLGTPATFTVIANVRGAVRASAHSANGHINFLRGALDGGTDIVTADRNDGGLDEADIRVMHAPTIFPCSRPVSPHRRRGGAPRCSESYAGCNVHGGNARATRKTDAGGVGIQMLAPSKVRRYPYTSGGTRAKGDVGEDRGEGRDWVAEENEAYGSVEAWSGQQGEGTQGTYHGTVCSMPYDHTRQAPHVSPTHVHMPLTVAPVLVSCHACVVSDPWGELLVQIAGGRTQGRGV
jgi:hypothetical protein